MRIASILAVAWLGGLILTSPTSLASVSLEAQCRTYDDREEYPEPISSLKKAEGNCLASRTVRRVRRGWTFRRISVA